MTEQDRVTVNDPRGPVNNGEGHQYVFYGVGADWMIRKGVESLRITREDRSRLADRFVPPMGYRAAADRLEKPGSVVLLEGPPGSGRRAAAIMLLHGFGEDRAADHEEIRFEELPSTGEDESHLVPGRGDRFLLTSPESPTRRRTTRLSAAWPCAGHRSRRWGPTWSSSCRRAWSTPTRRISTRTR
ncbi:hypothetical protein AB0G82_23740 [Streptomyces anulatus]|uniref:hypothetical protein n=1 Tax=Streptomyces anulatus TaxID=1892 RepID=UPI0033D15104